MLIELTNESWEKFYVNISLISTVVPLMGNKSQINLTSGNYVVCIESNTTVARMVNDMLKSNGQEDALAER